MIRAEHMHGIRNVFSPFHCFADHFVFHFFKILHSSVLHFCTMILILYLLLDPSVILNVCLLCLFLSLTEFAFFRWRRWKQRSKLLLKRALAVNRPRASSSKSFQIAYRSLYYQGEEAESERPIFFLDVLKGAWLGQIVHAVCFS